MFSYKYIIFVLAAFSCLITYGQQVILENFKWQNRIVVIISEDANSELYKAQLKELEKDNQGFCERKLMIFDVQKEKYRKITYTPSNMYIGNWKQSKKIFTQFYDAEISFKTFLLGLDGGVKKVFENKILTKENLFTIIDGMFMRKQELNRKN